MPRSLAYPSERKTSILAVFSTTFSTPSNASKKKSAQMTPSTSSQLAQPMSKTLHSRSLGWRTTRTELDTHQSIFSSSVTPANISFVSCHRSTARKFLAATNFFEVLQVFPKADISESVGLSPSHLPHHLIPSQTESRLKYAKWKAADIAKALREGRRPTPGPAGSQLDPDLTPSSDQLLPEQYPPTPPRPVPREPSPPTKSSSRSPKRQSPPPALPPADIARANHLPILPGQDKYDNEALSPGRWSTTATPGFDLARTPGLDGAESASGSSDNLNNWHEHVVDPMTRVASQAGGSQLRTAWVSTEMEGAATDEEPVEDVALNADTSRGRARFSIDQRREPSPPKHAPMSPSFLGQDLSSPPPVVSDLPPGFVPTGGPSYTPTTAGSTTFGSPRVGVSSFVVPPPPPHVSHSAPTFSGPHSPPVPVVSPTSSIAPLPAIDSMLVPAYPPPREVELTPKIVSKAQKHCRFAMSALDYEDRQHAIRELKAALETLGVSI